jgi:hypothetical protein
MTSARETAIGLLKRLLAGEREQTPLHLAMLLEKSSPLKNSEEHYRQILPAELADLRVSHQTIEEITGALCAEVSRNPDRALIFAMSFSGSDQATKTVAKVIAHPPRPLTIGEYGAGIALLNSFLPTRLTEDSQFLPKPELLHLVQVVEELQNIEENGPDRSDRIHVRHIAPQLLKKIARLGITAP